MESTSQEKKISQYLNSGLSYQEIVDTLYQEDDVHALFSFLYHRKQYKEILKITSKRLQLSQAVPWKYVIWILSEFDKTDILKKDIFKKIFNNSIKEQVEKDSGFLACKKYANLSPEFREHYDDLFANTKKKNYTDEKDLFKKLKFAQSQGLIQEEKIIIKKLLNLDPKNDFYLKQERLLSEKLSLQIIEAQKKKFKSSVSIEKKNKDSLNEKTISLDKDYYKKINQHIKSHSENSKNMAFFLYFLGDVKRAAEIFQKNINSISDYWIYLNWLLEARQYVYALEILNLISKNKKTKSLLFDITYIKAQIFYNLEKKDEALSLMKDIVRIKPEYKSAQSLLNTWIKQK